MLAARLEQTGEPDAAHRLLLAQQAITDHVAAGLDPDELCARVLETLGETLGWSYGAVWRPDGESRMLRCTAVWREPAAPPAVGAFADVSRRMKVAPGRGLPGRVWAFRRPAWISDVGTDGNMPRHSHAVRAGLSAAVAFPIALGDDCAGVLEFFSARIPEPDAQVAAMFATVGGQLAQYLERVRLQADESRRVEAALRAERDRAQRYLDVAGAMIVVLDPEGRVTLVNRKGCAVLEREESDVLGADWFELAVPDHERDTVRHAFEQLVAGDDAAPEPVEHSVVARTGRLRTVAWHMTILRDADGAFAGHARVRRGRHGPARGRAPDHLPRLPRPADGAAEPHAARGAPQARARPLAADRRRRRAAPPRPRLLQARQRLARARGGRRADLPPVGASAGVGAGHRSARTSRRRRVPAPARRPPRRPRDRGRAGRRPGRRLPGGAVRRRRRRAAGVRLDRHRPRARATRATPSRCSPTPTRRCTRRRRPPAAAGRCSPSPATTRSSASRWRPGCAARSPPRSSRSTTSRSSTPRAPWRASRRCCAGTTPSAAGWSRPPSSSPSRRRPG